MIDVGQLSFPNGFMGDDVEIRKPFLKWAGGKRKLVTSIKKLLPTGKFRYVEPFVGSGAVFLNTDYPKNLLCDSNADLIDLFRVLKKEKGNFIEACRKLFIPKNNIEHIYYQLRDEFNATTNRERRSALFVYLNRHCFNGLCRYNRKGEFNVPFGTYSKVHFPEEEMRQFIEKLKDVELQHQHFRSVFSSLKLGDVVYCDPPYVPLSDTAFFTDYSAEGFSIKDHIELAELAKAASAKGAFVLISNHDTLVTRELYAEAKITPVLVQRSISCNGENRKKEMELIAVFSDDRFGLQSGVHYSNTMESLRALNNTLRKWLLENGYHDIAAKIESVMSIWERKGKRTRRNWWDVLAGDFKGNPCTIEGLSFPVLRSARLRKGWNVTGNCLCRNENEEVPQINRFARWKK